MTLESLLSDLSVISVTGDPAAIEITGICYDSRKVGEGSVFVALRGDHVDGHDFIARAIADGAAAVVAESLPDTDSGNIAHVHVENSRKFLADISSAFYGHPSKEMAAVGITGTNGKTTTAFLLHHLLQTSWHRCGMLGTVHYSDGETTLPATHTTPESGDLQMLLGGMLDNGCRGVVMEVSSHALQLDRVRGTEFNVGVFTNLSQDHLDFHKTLDNYFAAKCELFEMLVASGGKAVINIDDTYGRRLYKMFAERLPCITYGMRQGCDLRAVDLQYSKTGTQFQLEMKGKVYLVRTPLIGGFNVFNALAALAAGRALGINFRESVTALANSPQVPGRFERLTDKRPFEVFVDYAHTPDALEKALETARELQPGRIVTVFGCGGDRDPMKRPLMGRAAEYGSDICIVTSDNPRTEDPEAILRDVVKGMKGDRHIVISDRREAIATAINNARESDLILIAGKGHEDYQEINGEREYFDDRVVARGYFAGAASAINDVRVERQAEREKQREERRKEREAEEDES